MSRIRLTTEGGRGGELAAPGKGGDDDGGRGRGLVNGNALAGRGLQDFPAARSTAAASRVPPPPFGSASSTRRPGEGGRACRACNAATAPVAAAAAPRCTFTAFTEDALSRPSSPPRSEPPARQKQRVLPVVLVLVGGEGGGGQRLGWGREGRAFGQPGGEERAP